MNPIDGLARLQAPSPVRVVPSPALRPCRWCNGKGERHPDNNGSQFNCQDCRRPCGSYMVKDAVWRQAWPDYAKKKQELMQKYHGTPEYFRTHLSLCLGCLQKRLGRKLAKEDFDLTLPINNLLLVGMELGAKMQAENFPSEVPEVQR